MGLLPLMLPSVTPSLPLPLPPQASRRASSWAFLWAASNSTEALRDEIPPKMSRERWLFLAARSRLAWAWASWHRAGKCPIPSLLSPAIIASQLRG